MTTKVHEHSRPVPVKEAGTNGAGPVLLTREDILAADDVRTEPVDVPEWGGSVMVRGLTGSARDWLEARFSNDRGDIERARLGDFRAAYVSHSLVDASGRRIFSDDDVKALGEKSSTALQRVFDVAIRLSALSPEDADGLVEDLKGDPSGDIG